MNSAGTFCWVVLPCFLLACSVCSILVILYFEVVLSKLAGEDFPVPQHCELLSSVCIQFPLLVLRQSCHYQASNHSKHEEQHVSFRLSSFSDVLFDVWP